MNGDLLSSYPTTTPHRSTQEFITSISLRRRPRGNAFRKKTSLVSKDGKTRTKNPMGPIECGASRNPMGPIECGASRNPIGRRNRRTARCPARPSAFEKAVQHFCTERGISAIMHGHASMPVRASASFRPRGSMDRAPDF